MKTNTVHECHSVGFGWYSVMFISLSVRHAISMFLSFLRKFLDVSFRLCENSSLFRSFETSFHRSFVSFSEFSISTQHFFESSSNFRRKIAKYRSKFPWKFVRTKDEFRRISLSLLLHSTVCSDQWGEFACWYLLGLEGLLVSPLS